MNIKPKICRQKDSFEYLEVNAETGNYILDRLHTNYGYEGEDPIHLAEMMSYCKKYDKFLNKDAYYFVYPKFGYIDTSHNSLVYGFYSYKVSKIDDTIDNDSRRVSQISYVPFGKYVIFNGNNYEFLTKEEFNEDYEEVVNV